jgi:hypothetical protein
MLIDFLRSEAGRVLVRDLQEAAYSCQESALATARNKGVTLDQVRYQVGIADGIQAVIDMLEKKRMEQASAP